MDRASILKATWVCFSLTLAACTTGPKVVTDSDPSADFGRYRTYSWGSIPERRGA